MRQARQNAGFATAADAARAVGVSEVTYTHHENGSRGYTIDAATTYSRRFKVSLAWLLTGQDTDVPVLGTAAAGEYAAGRPAPAPARPGSRLNEWMARRKLTLPELAFKTRIPRGRLQAIAGGTAEPRDDEIDKLALALDCGLTDLFDFTAMDEQEALLLRRFRGAAERDKARVSEILEGFDGPPPKRE